MEDKRFSTTGRGKKEMENDLKDNQAQEISEQEIPTPVRISRYRLRTLH